MTIVKAHGPHSRWVYLQWGLLNYGIDYYIGVTSICAIHMRSSSLLYAWRVMPGFCTGNTTGDSGAVTTSG